MKKDKRNLFALVLALVMAFSLVGCSQNSNRVPTSNDVVGSDGHADSSESSGASNSHDLPTLDIFSPKKDIPCVPLSNSVSTYARARSAVAAIDADGALYTWGGNDGGGLGSGENDAKVVTAVPTKIMDDVVAVSMGYTHSAAIKKDGSLWMWGRNSFGALGLGEDKKYYFTSPEKVMDDVKAVGCGEDFTAVLKEDNTLWMWGLNDHGQLGNGAFGSDENDDYCSFEPEMVLQNIASFSCGYNYMGAITNDNTLWMWGATKRGQIQKSDAYSSCVPFPDPVMEDVVAVSCGYPIGAALKTDGSLWYWGWGHRFPEKLLEDVVQFSAGAGIIGAIKSDGSLWMWGSNDYGALGDGTLEDGVYFAEEPVRIMEDAAYVSCGWLSANVIKKDGTLWTWGANNLGQLGIGSYAEDTFSSVPVHIKDGMMVP